MNTRKTCKILTLASAAFATGAASAAVVSSAKDNIDITVSDNYRTVFNAGVTFRAEPAAEKSGRADISWIMVGGTNPGKASATGNFPAAGVDVPVDVPVATQMDIGRLDGGRASPGKPHRLVKRGAGTVTIGEARTFGGVVQIDAGTLALDKRTVPTALPEGALVHFDFSQEATITKDANGRVSSVANLGSSACALTQSTAERQPTFVRDLPSAGLSGLDFDIRSNADGRYLSFTPAQTLTTVVLVVDSRIYTPTHFMDGPFRCLYDTIYNYYDWLPDAYARFKSASAAWIDGLPIDVSKEFYETPGFSVVALQTAGGSVSVLGGRATGSYGGMRIFEVVGYDHALTDREVRDASAFLSRKWLGRTTPGYADLDGVADLQNVTAAGGTTIDVSAGTTEKVAALTLNGPVVKTGAGALEVMEGANLDSYLTVRGGTVGAASASDVTSNCEIAKLPTLHLDASRTDLIKTYVDNGTNYIWSWQDESGIVSIQKNPQKSSPYANYTYPWLNTDADALCNGLPVVDFGPCAPDYSTTTGASAPLSRGLHNVRAVYFVLGSQAGGGTVLGSGAGGMDGFLDGRNMDFFRGRADTVEAAAALPLFGSSCCEAVRNGEIFINGIKKSKVSDYVPNRGYELVELHTTAGCKFNNLGMGYENYVHGGFRLGEIIVFERPLTDRERVATRNYLMKKWFAKTDAELAPLPEKPAVAELSVRAIVPDVEVAIGGDISASVLAGTGTVETAGHTLSVKDLSEFSGKVKVVGGLVLNGKMPSAVPELVTDGRILHLDACEGVSAVTNDDGTVSVKAWASKLNDGLVAMPGPAYLDASKTNYPSYHEFELNARPVVNMAGSGQQHFLFCRNGVTNRLENIQSVFWVIGSQEGGGYLLGGGSRGVSGNSTTGQPYVSGYSWSRGGESSAGTLAEHPILRNNTIDAIRYGAWRLNGETVKQLEVGLSGAYDVVSCVAKENATEFPDADGLAFDGRYLVNLKDYSGLVGHQRIAELIVYNRRLSAEEVAKVEAYLQVKWGFVQKSASNVAVVEVSSDATVVCSTPQYVGKLFGAGFVEGDVTVKNFVADATAGALIVSGTLTIAADPVVEIKDFGSNKEVVIAEAASYEGVESLKNVTVVGGSGGTISVRVSNGRMVARRSEGIVIVVR